MHFFIQSRPGGLARVRTCAVHFDAEAVTKARAHLGRNSAKQDTCLCVMAGTGTAGQRHALISHFHCHIAILRMQPVLLPC